MLERVEGSERDEENHQYKRENGYVPPSRDQTHNLGMCSDQESNP